MRWVVAACALVAPGIALADPCEGRLPTVASATFSGKVRYVVDGDGLCVGSSDDPRSWIEVRLVDFNAPELSREGGPRARSALSSLAMNRHVECETRRGRSGRVRSHDRVFAVCRLNGQSLGEALRAAGIAEGGN